MRPLQQIVRRQLEYVHACTLETSATILRPIAAIGQKRTLNLGKSLLPSNGSAFSGRRRPATAADTP